MMAKRKKRNFYFVGFGNMAQAIYRRMDKKAFGSIGIFELDEKILKELDYHRGVKSKDPKEEFYLTDETIICDEIWWEYNYGDVTSSDIFLLAVKPGDIKFTCKSLFDNFDWCEEQYQPCIISVVAGVTTESLRSYLGGSYRVDKIVRAMPNLCAKKGMAMTGLYSDYYFGPFGPLNKNSPLGPLNNLQEAPLITKLFNSIGQALWVDKESELDSITAISGSGPAYIYYIMNAMIEAAQELGLEKSVAQKLVAQTIIGAGETGKDIDNLKREIINVSSKGGTTEKAIDIFKQTKLDAIIKLAVNAAHERSKELSKK
jgi:pyrroline-5-carboxylate reductase